MRGWLRGRRALKALRAQQDEQGPPDEEALSWSVCDWAPDDLLDCSGCAANGLILIRIDWETSHQEIEQCKRCLGFGLDPAQAPHWAVARA